MSWWRFYRKLIKHSIVGFKKPFKKSEAWIWLISEAKYEDSYEYRDFGKKERLIFMPRGTVSHSLRFLSTAFGWSVNKTARFIHELENTQQIKTKRIQQITQITICNYNTYQPKENSSEYSSEHSSEHSSEYKLKEYKKEKNSRTRFKKPTIKEVDEYAESIGFDLDAEYFVDWYESKGWYVGKNPMKDWRATVRIWKRNPKNKENEIEGQQYDSMTGKWT